MTGYALNIAIGLQVLLGALTTGLPAATNGKQASCSSFTKKKSLSTSSPDNRHGLCSWYIQFYRCLSKPSLTRTCRIHVIEKGGLATLVASYLARARGSNEPELSITRCKDLDHFIRETQAFQLDHGHSQGAEHDDTLNKFRRDFEALLGNANG